MIEKTYKPDDNQQRSILYVEGDVKQRSNSLRKLNGDVCVDLNGRTMGNGLELFNEQICKLQVTYLGLPQSTGVRAMDYIITDRSTVGELESGEVRLDEERSDELITLALGTNPTHACTSIQETPPL